MVDLTTNLSREDEAGTYSTRFLFEAFLLMNFGECFLGGAWMKLVLWIPHSLRYPHYLLLMESMNRTL